MFAGLGSVVLRTVDCPVVRSSVVTVHVWHVDVESQLLPAVMPWMISPGLT